MATIYKKKLPLFIKKTTLHQFRKKRDPWTEKIFMSILSTPLPVLKMFLEREKWTFAQFRPPPPRRKNSLTSDRSGLLWRMFWPLARQLTLRRNKFFWGLNHFSILSLLIDKFKSKSFKGDFKERNGKVFTFLAQSDVSFNTLVWF